MLSRHGPLSFEQVHEAAAGRWPEILSALGVQSSALTAKQKPCPGCGGKDRFRFDNKFGRGDFWCNGGGKGNTNGDGFDLLVHARCANDRVDAKEKVIGYLGLARHVANNAIAGTASPPSANQTEYHYRRLDGSVALIVTRTDAPDGGKRFFQKTDKGLNPKDDPDYQPLPYNLPDWHANKGTLLVVEGEKCADAVAALGFAATTNAGGATNWRSEVNEYFVGQHIILCPDNDEKGEAHIRKVAAELRDIAASIRVLRFQGLPPKGDIADWIASSSDPKAELKSFLETAPDYSEPLPGLGIDELLSLEIVSRPPLHDLIPTGFTLLGGAPKAGKSLLVEHIASEVAKKHRVLYLALEYNAVLAKERLTRLQGGQVRVFLESQIPYFNEGGKEKLQLSLHTYKPELLVIDTLSRIKRQAAKDGYEAETKALAEIKALIDAANVDCIAIHHTRKKSIHDNPDDPFERFLGSQALAAVPDNLMVLDNDCSKISLHIRGRLIRPDKKLFEIVDGTIRELSNAGAELVGKADVQASILDLLQEGPATQKEIAEDLGLDQGNVSRYCKMLQKQKKIFRSKPGAPWHLTDDGLF